MPKVFDGVDGNEIVARASRLVFFMPALCAIVSARVVLATGCAVRATVFVLRPVRAVLWLFLFVRATVVRAVLRAVTPRVDFFSVGVLVRETVFFDVSRVMDFALRSAASTDATLMKNAPINSNILFILSTINIMISELGVFNK